MKFSYLALFACFALNAHAGNELGNGGDSYAQEFTALGRRLVESIRSRPDPRIPDAGALAAAVDKTHVASAGKLELRGAEVDAINYPAESRIQFNRERWKEYDLRQKASLVLHEYLGVAGVDDGSYQISSAYLELPQLRGPGGAADTAGHSYANAGDLRAAPPAPKRWSAGVGTEFFGFTGNLGKLYERAGVPFDFRLGYMIDTNWVVRASYGRQEIEFSALETGQSVVTLGTIAGRLEYHYANEKQWNGQTGFDPYVGVVMGYANREIRFQNQINKDGAFTPSLSAGLSYLFTKRAALTLEGRFGPMLFKDRFDSTFVESGLPNTKGALYAANVGLQYFF